jgi:hypothetical protein
MANAATAINAKNLILFMNSPHNGGCGNHLPAPTFFERSGSVHMSLSSIDHWRRTQCKARLYRSGRSDFICVIERSR